MEHLPEDALWRTTDQEQVTLSLCITGVVPPLRSAFLLVSQIAGAIAAAAVVRYIIPAPKVMFNVQLAKGMTVTQGLFLEMFLTTELVFTILMLAAEVLWRIESV